jgi:hypothetical protein
VTPKVDPPNIKDLKSTVIKGVSFKVETFMNIDSELYKVSSIWDGYFNFGGHSDVIFRIDLKDKNKKTKTLFFTEDTYWLQGNDMSQTAIPELKYEFIDGMTDEEFYVKPTTPVETRSFYEFATRPCGGGGHDFDIK